MTEEKKEQLIRHLKYDLEIGADYLITDEDAVEIIKALEQQPNADCISREQAIKQCGFGMTSLLIADCLRRLPSVTSQPKMGKWIDIWDKNDYDISTQGRCNRCKQISDRPLGKFCKWCGAKMEVNK